MLSPLYVCSRRFFGKTQARNFWSMTKICARTTHGQQNDPDVNCTPAYAESCKARELIQVQIVRRDRDGKGGHSILLTWTMMETKHVNITAGLNSNDDDDESSLSSSVVVSNLLSGKLFGRLHEIRQLNQVYQRVCSSGHQELVLISGAQGTGKTALARSLLASRGASRLLSDGKV